MRRQVRLSLVGPTGAGKTTTAWLAQRLVHGAVVVSVAAPLRALETRVYEELRVIPPASIGVQDGQLLQSMRRILLERDADILTRRFTDTVTALEGRPLILNDDCRLGSKVALDRLGFEYVWIEGSMQRIREDITPAENTGLDHDELIDRGACSFSLDNMGDLEHLWREVHRLIEHFGVTQ